VRIARCRHTGECHGHGIFFTCKKHKNRPLNVRFYMSPIVITGEVKGGLDGDEDKEGDL
jgi:hypothetical protein